MQDDAHQNVDQYLWPSTVHSTWMAPEGIPGLVSVIVPAYNRAHYLRELFNSIAHQEYRPIELIVVDDGSTDDTEQVVGNWRRSDTVPDIEVRYIRQPNQGAPVARNRGLIESKGTFIQFLDSDDLLHPQKFSSQVPILQETKQDLVWAPFGYFRDEATPNFSSKAESEDLQSMSRVVVRQPTDVGHPESALYRRSACYRLGPWDETLARWQDWEYAFRIAAVGLRSIEMEEPYYFLREHDTGKIGDLVGTREGVEANLQALRSITSLRSWEDREKVVGTIRRLYVKTLAAALNVGTDAQVDACLRGVRTYTRSLKDHMTAWGVTSLTKIAGRTAAYKGLALYVSSPNS